MGITIVEIERRFVEVGESLADIGRSVGVSRQRIHQILAKDGVTGADLQWKRERFRADRARRLASNGLGIGHIAKEMGLSYNQVRDLCARNHIHPPKVKKYF